jgi:nucleoside-diphosphate-sugar epimerase
MAQTDERGTASLSDCYPMPQQRRSRAKRTEQSTDAFASGSAKSTGLTVAVTGPTGEIGISAVTALERDPAVGRIIGMARRPFDPAVHGWAKTTYQQGDIMDRAAVDALVADADVVIHLAFIVLGSRAESERVNLAGTRIVFEAAVAAERVTRLVYTSSAAAYGYYSDNPDPITEDVPPRGSPEHDYSAQKAACEAAVAEITALAATTSAPPGAYNIAGDDKVTLSNIAAALGGRPIRVPAATATIGSAVVARLPFLPPEAAIFHLGRTSLLMDTDKAKSLLGWTPKYTAAQTLEALAGAV